MAKPKAPKAPGDLILEPTERVLLATRPLFLWEPLVLLDILFVVGALYASGQANDVLAGTLLIAALVLLIWLIVRWVPWSRRWYVLTDRRVIDRWGVFTRTQARCSSTGSRMRASLSRSRSGWCATSVSSTSSQRGSTRKSGSAADCARWR